MRIKELFTVPEGQKITEKAFARVLISSVCSMLLCMACLISTTWAWFTVSIENTGNVIQIGNADVKVTIDDSNEPFASGTLLTGDCTIHIENSNLPDDFQKKATLYVTLSFDNVTKGFVVLDAGNGYKFDLKGSFGKQVALCWTASWFRPEGQNIEELTGPVTHLAETPAETEGQTTPTTETITPTETTDSTTETTAADSTEGTTVPTV